MKIGEGWEAGPGLHRGRPGPEWEEEAGYESAATDHNVREEGLQRLGHLRPSQWVGLEGRGIWDTDLPLEFRVELLYKSLAPEIYKTRLKTED